MRNVREHTIGICYSLWHSGPDAFLRVAQQAQGTFLKKSLIAKLPPPERDIVLRLRVFDDPVEILGTSLDRFFGVALEASVVFRDGAVQLQASRVFDGMLHRLANQNRALRHYGLKFSIFAPLSDELCADLYSYFQDWTERLSVEVDIPISFDIARDYGQFEHILENEHRRMVHGDIKAQLAALTS